MTRMKDRNAGHKPRIYKLTEKGMWWADVRTHDEQYKCDCFFTYSAALDQAHEYAAMNRAAQALHQLGEAA